MPGFLLDKPFTWLENKLSPYSFSEPVLKVLGGCSLCTTGQMALWIYLYRNGLEDYDVFNHAYFISIAILGVKVIQKLADEKS